MTGHDGISKRKTGLEPEAQDQPDLAAAASLGQDSERGGEVTLGLENACEGIAGRDTHRGYLGGLAVSTKDLPL